MRYIVTCVVCIRSVNSLRLSHDFMLMLPSVAKLTNALLHLLGQFLLVVCHVPQNFFNQMRDFGKLVNGCGPGRVTRHHLKGEGRKGRRREGDRR